MNYNEYQQHYSNSIGNQMQNFYKQDFGQLLSVFFKNPFNGIQSLIQGTAHRPFIHTAILYATISMVWVAGIYLMAGELRKYTEMSFYLRMAILPILIMTLISCISFGIKAAIADPVQFKSELLTGGLCGIPLGFLIVGIFALKILGGANLLTFLGNPFGGGILSTMLFLYTFVMMTNVLIQSLRAGKVSDVVSWYVAPGCIVLAGFVASQVMGNIF